MRRYETVFIVDPETGEEKREQLFQKVREIVDQKNGAIVETDIWGDRKLAYEIKKRSRGYYVRLDYCGDGDLVSEIERNFKIDDTVLKYMTVLLAKDMTPEKIEAEKAERENKEQADSSDKSNEDESGKTSNDNDIPMEEQ